MSAIRSMLIAYINKAFPVWIQELILQKNSHERVISLQGKPYTLEITDVKTQTGVGETRTFYISFGSEVRRQEMCVGGKHSTLGFSLLLRAYARAHS